MALVYTTVATHAQNGSLVQSLTAGEAASLAFDYAANYPVFLAKASALINQQVQAIEANEAEGQRNELTLTGWGGKATAAANTVNSQWAAGKVTGSDGKKLAAWPEYPTAIAWSANNGNALILRWRKEEWQLYLLVFLLIAVVGYFVYHIVTQNSWQLQTANAVSNPGQVTSSPGVFNGTPFIGGKPFRIFWLPWYLAAPAAGAVVAVPYVYKQAASVADSRAKVAESEREYDEAREDEE